MEFLQQRWVKPFASGISCIDTVDGECIRGLSADECKKACEDSPRCNYGYHIELPNEPQSYCLPLNGFAHWGNNNIFNQSTIQPQSSPILSTNLGVKVNVFQDMSMLEKSEKDNRNIINQLGVYILRYVGDSEGSPDMFMMPDFSFGLTRTNAMQLVVFRDIPIMSSISTTDERLRNGQTVFLKNHSNNNIFIYLKEDSYGFYPYTIRYSASSTFDVASLFHLQIVKTYPFSTDFVRTDDKFAIRLATIPVDDHVLYWDVDTKTNQLVFKRVDRDDMADLSHLDKFRKFQFIQENQVEIQNSQNFVSSQVEYLMGTFEHVFYKKGWTAISILFTLLVILIIVWLILQRK